MTAGKIHRGAVEYVVDCAGCEEQFVNHVFSRRQFVESLRDSKWKIVKGFWRCPKCLTSYRQWAAELAKEGKSK